MSQHLRSTRSWRPNSTPCWRDGYRRRRSCPSGTAPLWLGSTSATSKCILKAIISRCTIRRGSWRPRSDRVASDLCSSRRKLLRDWGHLLHLQQKRSVVHTSDSAPDIMRNGLQLLARHSLHHYTARVTVNPKSRDQDDDVKPERISRVIEHRYRAAERPSVK